MSGTQPPWPPVAQAPCARCFAPIPAGARVCPRCGAVPGTASVATTSANVLSKVLGVGVTIALTIVAPLLAIAVVPKSPLGALCGLGSAVLFLGSLVSLSFAKPASPQRAFALAVVLTGVGLVGVGVLLLAGAFAICLVALQLHR